MISLERQVRVFAGGVGFHRALLGYFVNPAWIALSVACRAAQHGGIRIEAVHTPGPYAGASELSHHIPGRRSGLAHGAGDR